MIETLKVLLLVIGGVLLFFVAAILICAVIGFLFAWTTTGVMALFGWIASRWLGPENAQQAAEVCRARLRNPQFGVLEAHYGALVPESLRRLYQNTDLLDQEDIRLADPDDPDPEGGYTIDRFLPADTKALEEIQEEFEEPLFSFAGDGFGNSYCVLVRGDPAGPCPVYFWDHECPSTLEEMKIADSLDEFVARPRRPSPAPQHE